MRSIKHFIRHPKDILIAFINHTASLWSDRLFLEVKYRLCMGLKLNLNEPKTFQEKIQWLKLYDRKPEYTKLVDKYAVKNYVAEIIGNEYIIPTFGIWNTSDEIDFNSLPDQFVLKTTHGGGSNGVIVCEDKAKLNVEHTKLVLKKSLKLEIFKNYREWPYKNVPRRIIAEKYLEMPGNIDLTDYKFFCFNGIPRYIQVIQDRNTKETIDFFDMEWNHLPFVGLNPKCKNANNTPFKPTNLNKMIQIAEKLSEDIPFLRVDLYNIEGKIYFGELTFYPASGFGKFTPKNWDLKLGQIIDLPNDIQSKL